MAIHFATERGARDWLKDGGYERDKPDPREWPETFTRCGGGKISVWYLWATGGQAQLTEFDDPRRARQGP